MTVLVFAKSQLGAVIEVRAAPSASGIALLTKAGQKVPPTQQLKMLVDTGAETSALDEDIVTAFGVPYVRGGWIRTMLGTKPARRYELDFTLVGGNGTTWQSGPVRVMARRDAFVGAPYVGLIGRDILDQGLFIFNGPGHHCTLTF